jgi:hypothetical protein
MTEMYIVVKITFWKTCFEAYKISKIQELLGALSWTTGGLRAAPRPSASNSVAPFNSWIRPFIMAVWCVDMLHVTGKIAIVPCIFTAVTYSSHVRDRGV